MANGYAGQIDVQLHEKIYPMKVDMSVIAEFQSETGNDFLHLAVSAMNAYNSTLGIDAFARAQELTKAISMDNAAWLFFLAAKKMDKLVTFEEIQEAVLAEGPIPIMESEDQLRQSYPLLFVNLCMFSVLGVTDTAKKQH
jgi:hypothetical protein